MRDGWWLVPVLFATPAAVAHAQVCMPTPEAAAQSIVGPAVAEAKSVIGFRVQDVQVDRVMQRLWVRVARCEAPGAPLILVPLHAALSGIPPLTDADQVHTGTTSTNTAEASGLTPFKAVRLSAIHAGDAVLVTFASAAVQMEVEGRAENAAALGETVGVTLRRHGDEPAHRMRGILRADHRVEVRQ